MTSRIPAGDDRSLLNTQKPASRYSLKLFPKRGWLCTANNLVKLIKTCVRIQLPHRSATQPHQSTAVYRAFNSSPPKIELKYGHRIFINFPGHKKDLVSLLCLAGFPLNLLAITRVRIAFSRLAEFQIPPSHGVEWWWLRTSSCPTLDAWFGFSSYTKYTCIQYIIKPPGKG